MYLCDEKVREKQNFNLDWYFYHGDNQIQTGQTQVSDYEPVKLPHDWSLYYPWKEDAPSCGSGGYAETGIGWYRRIFDVNPQAFTKGRVFIHFEGVYMLSTVWINGHKLGQHVYGYTPFEYEITQYLHEDGRENVLDVKVDNSAQPGSRWYSGSGITRNVWIVKTSDTYIAPFGVGIQIPSIEEDKAHISVEISLAHAEDKKLSVQTTVFSPDHEICLELCTDRKGETNTLHQQGIIGTPLLWEVDAPFLYEAVTLLYDQNTLIDEVHTFFGIRTAVFDADKGFLLNGRQVKLNGVCIHHDGGCMGAAVPLPVWKRRLEKLKEMGVNALRMAHNPPDSALLELCDRMGFLVMDEAFDEWHYLKGNLQPDI